MRKITRAEVDEVTGIAAGPIGGDLAGLDHKRLMVLLSYIRDPDVGRVSAAVGVTVGEVGKWLREPRMIAALKSRQQVLAERYNITIERIVAEEAKIAFATLGNFLRRTGNGQYVIDLSQATEDDLAALSDVQVETHMEGKGEDAEEVRRTKVRLHDKGAALKSLKEWVLGLDKRTADPRSKYTFTLNLGVHATRTDTGDETRAGVQATLDVSEAEGGDLRSSGLERLPR